MAECSFWSDLSTGVGFRKQVNPKCSIRLQNRTKYFDSAKDRSHVVFGSSESYSSRQSKIEGYETRLYYEFKWCLDHDGQTFFYTLTYNNDKLPRYLGQVCFDYDDLRFLLNGGFKKKLLRKFGTNFRYFVGAELGDGKGKRGLHNNPHYHVLFFLRDAEDSRYPYRKILPEQFRHLIREYWQGFDEDTDGWHSYKQSKFGIAREGENLGLVTDYRAVSYVAKYVCKDVALKAFEKRIFVKRSSYYRKIYSGTFQSYLSFFHIKVHPMFGVPLDYNDWNISDCQLMRRLSPVLPLHLPPSVFSDGSWLGMREDIIKAVISWYNLWDDYYSFVDEYSQAQVQNDIRIYRNRYCNKCRISQHVGDYALDFVDNPLNPLVPVPSKQGIKKRNLGLFLYRKLYNDVYTDISGQNHYFLNQLGIDYKLSILDSSLSRISSLAKSRLDYVLSDESLFNRIVKSDCNASVNYSFQFIHQYLADSFNDVSLIQICNSYALFKLVYEDRFFKVELDKDSNSFVYPNLDYRNDYKRFLASSFGVVEPSDSRLSCFLASPPPGVLPYFSHPAFLRYSCLFSLLDLITDYFFVQNDDKLQAEAERIAEVKRYHNKLDLLNFYKYFAYGKN